MALYDLLDYRAVLADVVLIHNVGVVDPYDGLVCRDLDDIELVYRAELLSFGRGGTGHAGELAVETEVILEGYGRKGLVFLLDIDVLLGLDRLMQTLRVAAAEHETAGELIDDDYLAVLDDIVNVALHYAMRLERLIYMVRERGVLDIGEVFKVEGALCLGDAVGGERRGLGLLVDDIVRVEILALLLLLVNARVDDLLQTADEVVRLTVKVGALVALTGDDERSSGFIDEDGVDLVDDGEGMSALNHVLLIERHVIAQIVKAHLVVRAVGDIAVIGFAALVVIQPVDDKADTQAEEAVHLAHPFAVALGKVIVHGDDVDALAGQCVEVGREHSDKRFAFAGLHFGDAPLMQDDAADELHPERAHAEHAPRGLAHGGVGLGQDIVQRLALGKALLEFVGLRAQLLIGFRGVLIGECFYLVCYRVDALELTVGIATEQLVENSHLCMPFLKKEM